MNSKLHLDKYTWADIRRAIFSSRWTLVIIFTIIFVSGILIPHQCKGDSVWEGIGGSLIASAIVSLATIWIDAIRTGKRLLGDQLLECGLRQAFQSRAITEEYEQHLKNFKQIDVAGYTLGAFTESNEGRLRSMHKSNENFKVRMLLVDPDSESAKLFEQAEDKTSGSYSQALSTIKKKLTGLDEKVELRLLKCALPMMIYRIDRVLYTGPYPHKGASRNALTIKTEQGWIFDRLTTEFNELWELGTKVELNTVSTCNRKSHISKSTPA